MGTAAVFVPVEPKGETTHIRFDVDHMKGWGVMASLVPCQSDGNRLEKCNINDIQSIKIEPMPRFNKKRLEVIAAESRKQVETRNGVAWDLVLSCAKKHNLTILLPDGGKIMVISENETPPPAGWMSELLDTRGI